MNLAHTYQISIKGITILALVSVLWSSSITYYTWYFEINPIACSHSDPLDSESEESTEKTKKNLDDKLRSEVLKIKSKTYLVIPNSFYFQYKQSFHFIETPTPPPKFLS